MNSHSDAALPMLSRRRLLQAAGATAAVTVAAQLRLTATPARAADAYDTLRGRWHDLLTGSGFDPTAQPYAGTLAGLGGRARDQLSTFAPTSSSLWPDLPLGTASANITSSYKRLRIMAMAWAQPGTGLTGDAATASAVITGLDQLHATAYTPTAVNYNNWWDWQIGSPRALLDVCVLMYAQLTATQLAGYLSAVDHSVPDSTVAAYTGRSTGANRVDLCRVLALRGVLGKSTDKLATASNALTPVFPYVLTGDGLYADGSFVQHTWVPYTGSYGSVLLDGLSKLLSLLAGTEWQVNTPQLPNLFTAVTNAFAPFVFNGLVMDGVSGRSVSRGLETKDLLHLQQNDHTRGHGIIGDILRLAASGAAPADQSATWKAAVKGWISRDYYSPYLSDGYIEVPELARAEALLKDSTVPAAPEPLGTQIFAMDRAVVRRARWTAALSVCSARTTFYENGNKENVRGWHTNSGMLYWWGDTYGNGQYSDNYWPTVNPYRLPGTTVSTKPLADAAGGAWGAPRPDNTWAGGATDGMYAAYGQDVRSLTSTLSGRKSWFLLDDSIVCLGAGITCTDGVPVETIIDNRNLGTQGTSTLTVDGADQPTTLGWSGQFNGARSIGIAGFGGYVFPGGATVHAVREARTGSWHDINGGSTTEQLTRRYLTLWIDHGTDPTAAAYSYLIMPGASASTAAARAANPTVTVVANSASAQAIHDTASGVTAANFFAAGEAGPITASAACSVLLREKNGTMTVTVSDPSRTSATVQVTIAKNGYHSADPSAGVSILTLGGAISLLVETGGTQGAGRTVTLHTIGTAPATAAATTLAPTQDTYLRDGIYANTNYGTEKTLTVKNATPSNSGYSRRALLDFDTSSVTGTVQRAVLWTYGRVADSAGTLATLQAFATDGTAWIETAATWNRSPAPGTAHGTGQISTTADWIPLDVTDALNGVRGTISLAIWQPSGAASLGVYLHSRENDYFPPFLQLIST
ncbi:polysaccharide lyase family 8 super-sandwich domain-containing protein [Streptomyces sp. NPDC058525]|uniref:polysaccharide lyase family 8 super-sandwich domain-containing protein n=1 Tax=Streptomyces sp. NPDC058525 TaxID=3346538 RepID=UPI003646CE6E